MHNFRLRMIETLYYRILADFYVFKIYVHESHIFVVIFQEIKD